MLSSLRKHVRLIGLALATAASVGAVQLAQPAHASVARPSTAAPAPAAASSPIKHVLVIYQENHTFDNVLGPFCVAHGNRCDGVTVGQAKGVGNGTLPLTRAEDVIPEVDHSVRGQALAIDGGAMDKFYLLGGCRAKSTPPYRCYEAFQQDQIPTLWTLAEQFAVGDRTFSMQPVPSFGAHLDLAAGTLDGFTGDIPKLHPDHAASWGWGCNSYKEAYWQASPTDTPQLVPSCVPKPDGSGPYKPSPVQWVPTIFDRLQAAGLSWKAYTPAESYFNVCTYFADCWDTDQAKHDKAPSQVFTDAANGHLPSFAFLFPNSAVSQHNDYSMMDGDNYIESVVSAVMNSSEWNSTAIFITYDDCGCFYDHVAPPAGSDLGLRMPMVIVSPWVKPASTDHHVATFASILAFTEHTLGLTPLGQNDSSAYDFSGSFDYSQTPIAPIPLQPHAVPKASTQYMRAHPPQSDYEEDGGT